jgi:hypothetical protein
VKRLRGRSLVVILVTAGALAAGSADSSLARFQASAPIAAVLAADVLDPPTQLRCSGLLICSATLLSRPVLTWVATPDAYASGYRVYRSTTSGGGYVQVAQIPNPATTTWTDSGGGLTILTTYYYVVLAYHDPWQSVVSNQAQVTIVLG